MSPKDTEITGVPPRGVGVADGQGVTSWEPRFNSIQVRALPGGHRRLDIRLGDVVETMMIPPEAAARLAALLIAEPVA